MIDSLNEQKDELVTLELPTKKQRAENLRAKPESNFGYKWNREGRRIKRGY